MYVFITTRSMYRNPRRLFAQRRIDSTLMRNSEHIPCITPSYMCFKTCPIMVYLQKSIQYSSKNCMVLQTIYNGGKAMTRSSVSGPTRVWSFISSRPFEGELGRSQFTQEIPFDFQIDTILGLIMRQKEIVHRAGQEEVHLSSSFLIPPSVFQLLYASPKVPHPLSISFV